MYVDVTYQVWLLLFAIPDKAFQKALVRPEFSRVGPNGQRQINIYWLFPWAWSDDSGNLRYSYTAPAVRTAWPDYDLYDKDKFLQKARDLRYKRS